MDAFDYTCPFCQKPCTVNDDTVSEDRPYFGIANRHGPRMILQKFIVCPNPKCKEFTLSAWMYEYRRTANGGAQVFGGPLEHWALVPPSSAKVFPDYVPNPLLQDYREACAIRNLSPKASATLSRRCLQGMIRDFWGIKKNRLVDEIAALETHVDALTWKAIDAVRNVGNIGAHMEKDINVIIDVDPLEAEELIGLIELLIEDWYVTRHEREQRLQRITEIGAAKAKAKISGTAGGEPSGVG